MKLSGYDFRPHQPFLEKNTEYRSYKPDSHDDFYGLVWEVYQVDNFNPQKALAFPDISADFMVFYSSNKVSCYLMSGTKDLRIMTDLDFFKDVHTIFGVRFCSGTLGNLFEDVRTVGENIISGTHALINGDDTIGKLSEAKTFRDRWKIIKEYLNKRLDTDYTVDPLIHFVTNYIIDNKGNIKIKDLESLTGYSSRYLRKKINEGLGVSIKTFCGITQFQWSYHLSHQFEGNLSLAELAHKSGYYDQSHMNINYKKLTGLLPKTAINLYS